jgi:hypothetical protein
MSFTEIETANLTLGHCPASGQPLPADVVEDYRREPDCTHFPCPACGDILELPSAAGGFIPQHMPGQAGEPETTEKTFFDLLDDPAALTEALASIQLTGKQRAHLGELFASADGEAVRKDAGNRVQSTTRYSCSKIGGYLTKHFGGVGATHDMMWVGFIAHDVNGGERWIMRTQIREALVQLGWFGAGPTISSETGPPMGSTEGLRPQDAVGPSSEAVLLAAVQKSMSDGAAARAARLEFAPKVPEKYQQTTTAFKRNPDVIAQVLVRAAGACEACQKPAPFLRTTDNTPYLEVHHKVPLAADGFDTVDNAIAVCPNCHRKAHYGSEDPSDAQSSSLRFGLGGVH